MRLTCPNCGAEYEVPEGQIPAGGKHVQCTACHTRWFARAAQAALSEDQILARLETRGPRPRPTLVAVPETDDAEAPVVEPVPATTTLTETAVEAPPPEASPGPKPPPIALVPAASPPGSPEPAPDRAPPRDTGRLRIEAAAPERPSPPPASRFGRGLLVALVLAALAIAAYVFRAPLAATAPPAAPALDAYGDAIDAAREWLDQRLTPSR